MNEPEPSPLQKDLLKPIEVSSWALVIFGMLVTWWLPIRPDDQRLLLVLLAAFAVYLLVYFHWLYPRYNSRRWMGLVPTVANIAMMGGVYYFVGANINAGLIYIVIIVTASVRLGLRLAIVASVLSGVSVLLIDLVRSGSSPSIWISDGLTLLVYVIAGYLTGSLTATTRRQAERTAVVNEVARATGSTIEMEALLELIYKQLRRVIPTDTYYVGLYKSSAEYIDMLIVYDEGKHFPRRTIPYGDGLASIVIKRREPLLIRRLSTKKQTVAVRGVTVGNARRSESWLGVPMLMTHGYTGILVVASYRANAFDESDLALLTNVAGQIALGLDNARHHAQVEEQARRDSLTGVYNHGYWLERLHAAVDEASLKGDPISMIMLDIDYFKKYNDTYGHVMGDVVLRLTVQAIQAHVKQTDAVGRWGGEEFAIVLPDSTIEQARGVANRIRETLAAMPLVDRSGQPIPKPTVSQGIATFPDHVEDADKLMDLADQMLYQAKQEGRDQVRVAEKIATLMNTD